MKFKHFFLLIVLFIFIKKTFQYKLIYDSQKEISILIPDIVISPGGRYGMYSLGICHYIKNNFNIKNKKIVGFSSGAWNGLFMCMKKKYINNILREGFKINNVSVPSMLKKTINIIKKYNINQFNIENLHIGSCHFNKHMIYNKFITMDDVIRCCISSSFVPFITYYDIMYFYKNKLSFDGGFFYNQYKKTLPSTTLIISFRMFGRHQKLNLMSEQLKKNKPSSYQLYIKGYRDAVKNHAYFEKYLNHKLK
jgi:hypothetical protein